MNWPLLSVLMPCYNQGETLNQAIISVLNCGYPNVEIIVWDDGSTDGGVSNAQDKFRGIEQVKFYNVKGHTVIHHHGGKVREECLLRAQGKYITNVDSDDFALPKAFNMQVMWLEHHPEYGSCHVPAMHIKPQTDKRVPTGVFEMSLPGYLAARVVKWEHSRDYCFTAEFEGKVSEHLFEAEWEYSFMMTSGCVYRKELVFAVGSYDTTLPYRGSMQDYDLCLRMIKAAPTRWINQIATQVRKHESESNYRWGLSKKAWQEEWKEANGEAPYDRNRAYIQNKYKNYIKRKLQPIPYWHKPGNYLSACNDGLLNDYWPGMNTFFWEDIEMSFGNELNKYDVIYSSHLLDKKSSHLTQKLLLKAFYEILRSDGLLKLIVPAGINNIESDLEKIGFDVRENRETHYKGLSQEFEAIKRVKVNEVLLSGNA